MATGFIDANGIWQFGADDPRVPFQDTLNLGQQSVSTAVGLLKSRATALENANVLSALGTPFVAASGWTLVLNRGLKKNGVAWVQIRFNRSGAAITPTAGGTVDSQVATFAAGWAPASFIQFPTPSNGRVATAHITSTGFTLRNVIPGSTVAVSDEFWFLATYPVA